ncbi:MAG TPA: alpha/beta hydrolase [Victivallales bacterium]|nr:alpha/beta hydrolase [Victivallales bacterium]
MDIFLIIILVLFVIYFLIVLFLFLIQKKLIFHPRKEIVANPGDINLQYEEITFFSSDNIKLNGWFIPNIKLIDSGEQSNEKVILFSHGNAGNISNRLDTVNIFHSLGYSVFVYDYREYGKSEGKITEKGLYNDARAAWNYLTEKRGFLPNDIVVAGRSLGGAVAAKLASSVNPFALIIESTFTSIPDMALRLYPYFPFKSIIRFKLSNTVFMTKIKSPVLLIHSFDDELVPIEHGKILFNMLNNTKKEFLEINGDHNTGFIDSIDEYKKGIKAFLKSI